METAATTDSSNITIATNNDTFENATIVGSGTNNAMEESSGTIPIMPITIINLQKSLLKSELLTIDILIGNRRRSASFSFESYGFF